MRQVSIYDHWESISSNVDSAFARGPTSRQRLETATYERRLFYLKSVNFRDRGTLLITEFKAIFIAVRSDRCDTDSMLRARCNSNLDKYKKQPHNMLVCIRDQIREINSMCMSETLITSRIDEAFSEIKANCQVEKEIKIRTAALEEAISTEHAKCTTSTFYSENWDDCSYLPGMSATGEAKESEPLRRVIDRLEKLEKKVDQLLNQDNISKKKSPQAKSS